LWVQAYRGFESHPLRQIARPCFQQTKQAKRDVYAPTNRFDRLGISFNADH
jgi:hypothetical protein